MPLALSDKQSFFEMVDEVELKEWIITAYDPADLYDMDYLINKILGQATTKQLQFIDDAIHHRL